MTTAAFGTLAMSIASLDLERHPARREFLFWGVVATAAGAGQPSCCTSVCAYLDRDSRALRYGQATLLPFFVLHQPVILAVAYFVVRWQAPITLKLLGVILGAFGVSIGLVELVIKRVGFLRVLFGMKYGSQVKSRHSGQGFSRKVAEPQRFFS